MKLSCRNRADGTLAECLRAAFGALGALAATGALVTTLTYIAVASWIRPELARSSLAIKAEGDALTAMIDEQLALGVYLATRDVRLLEACASANRRYARANADLSLFVGTIPGIASAIVRERLAQERWNEKWARAAANVRASTVVPSMTEGRALFDAYRGEQSALAALLDGRRDTLAARERRVLTICFVLELILFLPALVLAIDQRRTVRDTVVRPLALLLKRVARIRDGRLEGPLPLVAARELCELDESLSDLTRTLAYADDLAFSREAALRHHTTQLRQILDAAREFSESLDLSYVARAVRESIVAIGGYERVIVWLTDPGPDCLVDSERMPRKSLASDANETARSLAGRAIKSGRITFEVAAGPLRLGDNDLGPVRALATPLIVGARVVGALEVRNAEAWTATRARIDVLETIATHAATALEAARLHQIAEERSHVDELTRLWNRRRLNEDLDVECKRCQRYSRPLAFVMLDVDHFKQFNDSHGHPDAGKALQELASIVADCMRTTDTAYRYGGEEFCVILRETTGLDAMHFAERLRHRIEQHFAGSETTALTASFGVADFSPDKPSPHELLVAADAAMYESKHAGRNRVMLSSRPPFALNGEFEPHPTYQVASAR